MAILHLPDPCILIKILLKETHKPQASIRTDNHLLYHSAHPERIQTFT